MTSSRKSSSGCACRVPLHEVALPNALRDAEALSFLAKRGIDVAPNHKGELSIPVLDAQVLWNEAAVRATDEVAEQARIRGEIHTANLRRREIFEETMGAAMRATVPTDANAARAAAWAAVEKYDRTLPKVVLERLDALPAGLNFSLS